MYLLQVRALLCKGKKMKVVFRGDKTADVSEIQSVSVSKASKRIEVCVKHKTGKKVWDLPIRKISFKRTWAEEVAKELEGFSEALDTPIDQVIASTAWARGYLQVKLDVNSDTSAWGLARLCWYWALSQTPTDEQLGLRTELRADEIKKVASRDIYKQHVKDLIFKERDADAFKKWVKQWEKNYEKNMFDRFGKRMQLSENTAKELIYSVAEKHDIDPKDLDLRDSSTRRRKSSISDPEKTIGIGRESVYLYYYPRYRESAESKGETVWACKIGKTIHSEADGRIRNQATGLPESPKIGLHIKTHKSREIEDIVHKILKVRGKHIDEAPGTEWFLTSPSEVEEIYNFIGESS